MLMMMMMMICVMLKIKCDQYWPADSEPLFYGDLQVKIMNENISSDWHIREMHISLVCVTVCEAYIYVKRLLHNVCFLKVSK